MWHEQELQVLLLKLTYFKYRELGQSTQQQHLQLMNNVLMEEDSQNSLILEKRYCLYTYIYDCKSNKYPWQDKKVNYGETGTNVHYNPMFIPQKFCNAHPKVHGRKICTLAFVLLMHSPWITTCIRVPDILEAQCCLYTIFK